MVQLSEEHIKEMYRCFMLLYVDEYDDDTLDSLGLDEVDDKLHVDEMREARHALHADLEQRRLRPTLAHYTEKRYKHVLKHFSLTAFALGIVYDSTRFA